MLAVSFRTRTCDFGAVMRLPSLVRGVVVLALLGASGCSGGPDEIRTVADFDAAPCLLFTEEAMRQTVAEPYSQLAGVEPKLLKTQAADVGEDTRACVYTFEAAGAPQVPQVGQMTVTVAHHKSGSQPLAICVAGAAQKAAGYKLHRIGDQACLSPTSDLWMRVGEHYYQVVVVPQPGFDNPVDANLALSPIILTVAEGAASRMPKS
jgi:hypothetical protein